MVSQSTAGDRVYSEGRKADVNAPSRKEQDEALERQKWDWWYQARTQLSRHRREMAVDANFRDGLQWSEEDRQSLEERGQPVFTFNLLHQAVEWVKGSERRARSDWKVLPRKSGEEYNRDANVKTSLLKHIFDVNHVAWERSRAFADAATVGLGWLECGIRDDPDLEPVFVRRESWRNIWCDPLSVATDLRDARYMFRSKVVDLDVAIAAFPDHEQKLRRAAETRDRWPYAHEEDYLDIQLYWDPDSPVPTRADDALYWNQNRRIAVRLIECWYRTPKKVQKMAGETEHPHQVYDETNQAMADEIAGGTASLYESVVMEMRVSVMLDRGGEQMDHVELFDEPSPYRHNQFPFIPIWAYRRDADNAPYGIIRNARDAQEDLNKRRSKAQWILGTNRVIAEKQAVKNMDIDEIADEASRPDSVFIIEGDHRFEINNDRGLAREHVMLEQSDQQYILATTGVTQENLGHESNATSGRAILARQEQGGIVTQTLFDNLRLAFSMLGMQALSLIEQFYTDEREIRITGEAGRPDFIKLNDEDGVSLADTAADFVIAEQDFRESTRVAMFESMMEMLAQFPPETSLSLLDMVLEISDIPEPVKGEWVRRIRKMTGQVDPDAESDEERMKREQAEAQAAQEERDLLKREREAKVEVDLGRAAQSHSAAGKNYADVVLAAGEKGETLDPTGLSLGRRLFDEGAGDLVEDDPFADRPIQPVMEEVA